MDKKKIIKGMVGVGSKAPGVAGAINGMSKIKKAYQSNLSRPSVSQGIVQNKITKSPYEGKTSVPLKAPKYMPLPKNLPRKLPNPVKRPDMSNFKMPAQPRKNFDKYGMPQIRESLPARPIAPKGLPSTTKKDIIKKGMGGCGKGGITQPFQTLGKAVKSAGKAAVSGYKKAYKSNVSRYDKESSGIRMPDTKVKAAIKGVIYGAGKGVQSLIKKNK